MRFRLTSPAFETGEAIPDKYTCDGQNISPPLAWSNPPDGTRSFVLIVDDPHAPNGTFTHWILYDIPANMDQLTENYSSGGWNMREGRNSFDNTHYDGPCPPENSTHMYHFKLFALNKTLDMSEGAMRADVLGQIHGNVIGNAELLGSYARQAAKVSR